MLLLAGAHAYLRQAPKRTTEVLNGPYGANGNGKGLG